MSKPVSLTGIKPTGIPHIGNYLGAIKPALKYTESHEAVYFIADYHALNLVWNGEDMRNQIYSVAATWLALGLDPETCHFYKQSDIPEIFEFNWVLSCFTPKGFMNRAHGYKDKVAKNQEAGRDTDDGINMGLYGYPCLMNADILMFEANIVPVGKDQKQHVEFTRDIATRFNKNYKTDLLTIPEAIIDEVTDVIPGMDGRKMSKSYDNTIEIFLPSKKLKKKVNKIVTNSQEMNEVKNPDECNVFSLYKFFSTEEEQKILADRYRAGGMGWGEAKSELHRVLDREFSEAREKYDHLMANTHEIDTILAKGALKARLKAQQLMKKVRSKVGVG